MFCFLTVPVSIPNSWSGGWTQGIDTFRFARNQAWSWRVHRRTTRSDDRQLSRRVRPGRFRESQRCCRQATASTRFRCAASRTPLRKEHRCRSRRQRTKTIRISGQRYYGDGRQRRCGCRDWFLPSSDNWRLRLCCVAGSSCGLADHSARADVGIFRVAWDYFGSVHVSPILDRPTVDWAPEKPHNP